MPEKVEKLAIRVKYSPKCKVCTCGYVDEINKLRLQGKTYPEIITFLKKERGLKDPAKLPNEVNLTRHFQFHYILPDVKRKAIMHDVKSNVIPTLALVPFGDVEHLLNEDIDYVSSLKVLVHKKMDSLLNLEERLKEIDDKGDKSGNDVENELALYRLVESKEKNLIELIDKLETKTSEYKNVNIIRNFVMKLVRLINELAEKSKEKEMIQDFRKKVADLVREYEE